MDSSSSTSHCTGASETEGELLQSSNIFTLFWFLAHCLFSLSVDYSLPHTPHISLILPLCWRLFHTDTHKQLSVLPALHQWSIMLLQCNNESLTHTVASGLTLAVKDSVGETFFFPSQLQNQHLKVLFCSLHSWKNGENSHWVLFCCGCCFLPFLWLSVGESCDKAWLSKVAASQDWCTLFVWSNLFLI